MDKVLEYLPFIRAKCRKISIPNFEYEDICQEIIMAVLVYLNECAEKNIKPLDGAVHNVIKRHLYRLIRANSTFDGCCDQTKLDKKFIQNPFSCYIQTSEGEINLFDAFIDSYISYEEDISNIDFINKFKEKLTPVENEIFSFMLMGYLKPREISRIKNGHADLLATKTISNHSIKIRKKFIEFWKSETGKIINGR